MATSVALPPLSGVKMILLSDKDYENAPDDPEEKFAFLAERCRKAIYARIGNGNAENLDQAIQKQYVATIRSLAKALGIKEIVQSSAAHISVQFTDTLGTVAGVVSRVKLKSAAGAGRNTVSLANSTKIEIEKKISRLRIYISQADMPESKRSELLNKLDELSSLLSEKRVSLGATLIILSSIALGATAFLAEIPDALKTVTSVVTMIAGDKEAEEIEKVRLEGSAIPLAIEDKRSEDAE
jgi:hypothetical protein